MGRRAKRRTANSCQNGGRKLKKEFEKSPGTRPGGFLDKYLEIVYLSKTEECQKGVNMQEIVDINMIL